jgi:hypothetical protein
MTYPPSKIAIPPHGGKPPLDETEHHLTEPAALVSLRSVFCRRYGVTLPIHLGVSIFTTTCRGLRERRPGYRIMGQCPGWPGAAAGRRSGSVRGRAATSVAGDQTARAKAAQLVLIR